MPFSRPTLAELVTRIRGDFKTRLTIANGNLVRRTMANILATVWAGVVHLLHGHLAWVLRQLFPDTSEDAIMLRQASLYGVNPIPATYWTGTATATGTNGEIVPQGTIFVRGDGQTYTSTAASAAISGGETTVPIQADDAGADPNMLENETLTFQTPQTDVDTEITIDAGYTDGADQEDPDGTRARFLEELADPPNGGKDADYIKWAKLVSGVTRVWVHRHELGLGTVVVRFVRDGDVSIIPDSGELAAVLASIEANRPTTAIVSVPAPTELEVDFTLSITPDTTAIRAAISSELADLFRREAATGDTFDTSQGVILLSHITTAIGVAVGTGDYSLSSPSADVTPDVGELATLGTFTYT